MSKQITPLPPEAQMVHNEPDDFEALYKQYIPGEDEDISWDDYLARVIAVVERIEDLTTVLGHLAWWGYLKFAAPAITQRKWEEMLADAVGCNRSYVHKLMAVAKADVDWPRDKRVGWRYDALRAGRGDEEFTRRLIDVALGKGWSGWDMHLAATLYHEGLTGQEIYLPRIVLRGALIITKHQDEEEVFARVVSKSLFARAGLKVLRVRGRF